WLLRKRQLISVSFASEWLENPAYSPWLSAVADDPYKMHCNKCQKKFGSTLTQIKRHMNRSLKIIISVMINVTTEMLQMHFNPPPPTPRQVRKQVLNHFEKIPKNNFQIYQLYLFFFSFMYMNNHDKFYLMNHRTYNVQLVLKTSGMCIFEAIIRIDITKKPLFRNLENDVIILNINEICAKSYTLNPVPWVGKMAKKVSPSQKLKSYNIKNVTKFQEKHPQILWQNSNSQSKN
ncbi:unnamed protein product, partial [Meganyctiphanes norvegica]